jgi:Winged helix DNA-binding domain
VTSTNVSWPQVLRWRVRRHLLAAESGRDAVAVARRVCGVHAQLAASAVAAIRLRVRTPATVSAESVDAALYEDRALVKTWAARGTLHLVAAGDVPTWVAAMSTRSRETKGAWLRYNGVTAGQMADLLAALPDVLHDKPLTRAELADRIVAATGHAELAGPLGQGFGALLKPAAFQGLLCFGPPRGRNVTFVAPRAWLGDWQPVDAEDAIDTLVLGHLGAYGPADADEFARWFDLTPRLAKRAFARLADALAYVDLDGRAVAVPREYLDDLLATPAGRGAEETTLLLPAFDPYVVGSLRQLDAVVVGPHKAKVSRPQGWISPALIVDGRIEGTWELTDGGRARVTPFDGAPYDQDVPGSYA